MAPLIDSLEQISEKARIEIKAWLEPWFEGRKAGGPGPNPRIDSTENVGDRWGVHSVEPDGAFERLRQFLKTDGAGGSKWGPQTIGEAFQGIVLSQPTLFAYWPMSEASGTLADLGPHNIPMIQSGTGATYGVAGPFPPLTAIDMNNTDYFSASISGTLANTIFGSISPHPFTIVGIANMPALADTDDAVFAAHFGATQIAMYFSTIGGDNVLYNQRDSDTGTGGEQPTNRNLLLVYRYDGTNIETFVDGVQVGTTLGNDNLGSWGTTTLYIGALGTGTPAKTQAIISNVALFTDAISDEVIAELSAGFALGGQGGSLSLDHGGLYGLADDDHPQYVLRSIITTIGDLFVATTAGVLTRLANGSAGQALEADPSGSAPGVKWADRIKSLCKFGGTPLFGAVTLSEGANVTLTQSGQNIEVAATVVGSGAVDSIAVSGDTPMVGNIEFVAGTGITLSQDDVDTLTITAAAGEDGWSSSTDTWTYASGSGGGLATFTIAGVDRTVQLAVGTRIKLTQTTAKYFVVTAVAFSTNTTVTIMAGTDYTLANAAITLPQFSYMSKPQGYPNKFAFSPAITGFSAVSFQVGYFQLNGGFCSIWISCSGTSNATSFGLTLPIAVNATGGPPLIGVADNAGAVQTAPAMVQLTGSATTVSVLKTWMSATTTWSNSSTKSFYAAGVYAI